ncbi:hypothetical protein AXA44_08390 [Rhodococcus sp. SC4]|nr:hypothetical protein AXA44_08390 [Rhodococcus sp. SC4]
MTNEEEAMVVFALRWAPYGGGDEHILPQFGLLPAVYYRRLQRLLTSKILERIGYGTKRSLLELCAVKLAR